MKEIPNCFQVPPLTKPEVYAIQAMSRGEARPHEQVMAMYVIMAKLSRSYDQHFVPGHQDQSNFLEGRGFVGQQIRKFIDLDANLLDEVTAPEEKRNARRT